ncbi:hypothetical protein SH668x_002965 [Planctomicrobium sp. SH668]|uniref:hypothetical protein n=1 Tax=Planctomicrobium sp. SH668 TaxID=3448126 RepID=UPI003F5C351B
MAKKAKSTEYQQPGVLYGVRCPEEDSAAFERAAYLEGFSTVQQWLIAIGRKRSRAILQAAEKVDSVTLTEIVVIPNEK